MLADNVVDIRYTIGVTCDSVCNLLVPFYSHVQVPFVSVGCPSMEYRDRSMTSEAAYFSRVAGHYHFEMEKKLILNWKNWDHIYVISQDDPLLLDQSIQFQREIKSEKNNSKLKIDFGVVPSCRFDVPFDQTQTYNVSKNILTNIRFKYNSE